MAPRSVVSASSSVCDKVLRFELPDVDKVEDVIVEPRLDLGRLRLDEHAGVDLELFECCLLPCTVVASGV